MSWNPWNELEEHGVKGVNVFTPDIDVVEVYRYSSITEL